MALRQAVWCLDDGGNPVRGLGQQVDFLGQSGKGCGCFGQRLREFRLGAFRREGISTTPAGSGGRPAVVHSSSAQAARCAVSPTPLSSSGVQEARISTSARGGSSAIAPNDSLDTEVTVPLGDAVRGAVGVERVDQPGPADPGQQRIGDHLGVDVGAGEGHAAEGALPGGVAGRVVQQDQPAAAESSSPTTTSAVIAAENGAMRCGAGISSTCSSGRQARVSRSATARRNASGPTDASSLLPPDEPTVGLPPVRIDAPALVAA